MRDYLAKTDPLGANVPNPVSHVAYGYATQVCILDKKTGKIDRDRLLHMMLARQSIHCPAKDRLKAVW